VTISTAGSDYDTQVGVYEGTPGAFRLVHGGCNDDAGDAGSFQSRVTGARLRPNTTYSIEVSQILQDDFPSMLRLNVAAAPTYHVTKVDDTTDGTCAADCSLRQAVAAANAAPGAVLVPAGTYVLGAAASQGDLDITSGMAIYGAGATIIDAHDVDRVIHVDTGNTSRVSLTLACVALLDGNGAAVGGGGVLAEGIGNYLDVDSVVVDSGTTTGNGGGIRLLGRGRLVRSVLSGNRGLAGGGINAPGGSNAIVEVRDSTIESNTSTSPGSVGGGGLHSTATLEVVNTTVHGNTAAFGGGGIHLLPPATATPALRSVTVSGNTSNGAGSGGGGGVRLDGSGAISVRNSVVADNVDTHPTTPRPDCLKGGTGALTSAFNHLEATAGGCALAGTGDVSGSDPALEPLAANGGPTRTQRMTAGSPLIDAGDPDGCADRQARPLAFDQRGDGFPRSRDGNSDGTARCDKGAYEAEPANSAPVCASDPVTTPEDTPLPVTLSCTDPEGAPVAYGDATALHGTVTGTGAERTYTPAQDYNGPDTVTFSASDGTNPPVTATIQVTVTPVNDAPVAAADTGATGAGVALTVPAPGVLANDGDVDQDGLTAEVATPPANGAVVLGADGGYVYTPAGGFAGTDTFTYVARDATTVSAPATVTITVAATANPPPTPATHPRTPPDNTPPALRGPAGEGAPHPPRR
jgi:CSLREA domain-containing protein